MKKMVITLAIPGLAFNGNTFDAQSLGGSESAGYYMARALAKLGHSVTVFCGTTEITKCADVDYLPIGLFGQYVEYTPHDVCIVQRAPTMFAGTNQARFSALWCHDLALRRAESEHKSTTWNFDKFLVLSEFMRNQYREVYGLDDSQMVLVRNGVDTAAVADVEAQLAKYTPAVTRNPLSLVYASRPERGLDIMLGEIMPRILAREPNARLFLATYDNKTDSLADYNAHCAELAKALGDHVVHLGALTKAKLFELYLCAGVLAYPLPSRLLPEFDEVSCITAMEAQACGLPFVSSARGALPETLAPGAGTLVSDAVHTGAYFDNFADACLRYMQNATVARQAGAAGRARAAELTWDAEAMRWSEMFEREIRARSASTTSLVNHFWRRSDIYAAKRVLDTLPADDPGTQAVRERIAKDFAFIETPQGFREQYERIGATHNPEVVNWSPHEPRYKALSQWLALHAEDVKSVLDYGCAHGGYAINLLVEHKELFIQGVDIDLNGIRLAQQFAEQKGVAARWAGMVGTCERLYDDALVTREFDAALAQEVLEHVQDPAQILAALEHRVRDGGYVYITVPYGPWEYSDYRRYPHRAHIWEFDLHDLHNLLDIKGPSSELTIAAMPFGRSPETDDPLGWMVVQYRVTPEGRGKFGTIDWERKLAMQRPRQTVSGLIMAGPNVEETLHWCLKSLVHVVDELVIADCGMSEEALRILDQYRWRELDGAKHDWFLSVKVIPGGDPKVDGFETPRNKALAHCTQDWVLWIDTDEKLLQPSHLTKYLRPNAFAGYSIRQHHFAVDTTWSPDLPVRLFRNDGKLRFYGMIHEHPERGLNQGPGMTVVLPDVHIPHVGYLIESGRQVKFNRNLPMLEADIAKYPDRILQKHFIMRDKMLLVAQELRAHGNRRTPAVTQLCEDVVRLYREHFLGKGHFTNVDPFDYYSQAVGLLGIGFDAVIQLSVDKVDAQPGAVLKGRFANEADYLAEIDRRARAAAAPMNTRYW